MKATLIFTIILCTCLLYVNSAPIFEDDFDFDKLPDDDCTNFNCPSGTTSCVKKSTTSDDRKTIKTELKCYGSNGKVLHEDTKSEKNPNPYSIQNTYEFHGSYSSGSNTVTTGTSNNKTGQESFERK